MSTCSTCRYYLAYHTQCCIEQSGNRFIEIEKVKSGLEGRCKDHKKPLAKEEIEIIDAQHRE